MAIIFAALLEGYAVNQIDFDMDLSKNINFFEVSLYFNKCQAIFQVEKF